MERQNWFKSLNKRQRGSERKNDRKKEQNRITKNRNKQSQSEIAEIKETEGEKKVQLNQSGVKSQNYVDNSSIAKRDESLKGIVISFFHFFVLKPIRYSMAQKWITHDL